LDGTIAAAAALTAQVGDGAEGVVEQGGLVAQEYVGDVRKVPLYGSALAVLRVDGIRQPAPKPLPLLGNGEVEPGERMAAAEGLKLILVDPGGPLRHLLRRLPSGQLEG